MAGPNAKKVDEALEHIKLAEKSLKTSFLKWKADYDIASDEYNKAAMCYKGIKSYQEAKDCFMKSAEYYEKSNSLFNAAKNYEQVILICKELGELPEIAQLAERACIWYQQHGSPVT